MHILRATHPLHGKKESIIGHIHERPTKKGWTYCQVEIRRKGYSTLFRTFRRKTDVEKWMHKTEADLCSGRY
jgi:hypothetical protein